MAVSPVGFAQPPRTIFEGDCRPVLGTITHRHWDTGLSMALYFPPPDLTSRKRLRGNIPPIQIRILGAGRNQGITSPLSTLYSFVWHGSKIKTISAEQD